MKQGSVAIRKMEKEVTGRNVGPQGKLKILGFHRKWMAAKTCYLNIKGESQSPGNTQATDTFLCSHLSLASAV